jgi:uncharacterized protein with gpF-like domain
MTMKSKNDLLNPIFPNAGIEAAYAKRLIKMVDAMHKSVDYWVSANYRSESARLATDASPANELRDLLRRLSKRWIKLFDDMAQQAASNFVTAAADRVDANFAEQFRKRDFRINFKLTAEARNALQAVIGDNVGLIRSIPRQYLSDVEGLVMRSIAVGGDRFTLSKQLMARHGLTAKRASFIAKDQNSKANAVMTRVRQEELGIVEAEWKHSHAGREPRQSHVHFDGKRYDVRKGAFIDDKWIYPGQEPNCRCVSRSVIPMFERK